MAQYIALRGKYGRGQFAMVDDEDFENLNIYTWFVNNSGYAFRLNNGQTYLMHREILGLKIGDPLHVDHIDHNIKNNTKNNLRTCSMTQNTWNSRPRGGSSKYKGVFLENKLWGVKIQDEWIGTYYSELDAALIYDREARKRYGQFAYLNFPHINDYSKIKSVADNRYSQYKGISFNKTHNKWCASFYSSKLGKLLHIGSFNTEQEAYQAREKFLNELQ